jgi:hypothetical protein
MSFSRFHATQDQPLRQKAAVIAISVLSGLTLILPQISNLHFNIQVPDACQQEERIHSLEKPLQAQVAQQGHCTIRNPDSSKA